MKVEHATIHTGPYADELARSLHTLALVLGTDIFFRNGAYRPETEEGSGDDLDRNLLKNYVEETINQQIEAINERKLNKG